MKKMGKNLLLLSMNLLMLVGVFSTNIFGSLTEVQATTTTITINATSFGGSAVLARSNYNSGAERTATIGSVDFGGKAITCNSINSPTSSTAACTFIQAQENNGVIYNTTALPGRLLSITLNQGGTTNRSTTLSVGNLTDGRLVNSTSASYNVKTGETIVSGGSKSDASSVWSLANNAFSGDRYFFALKRGASTQYISSITVVYETPVSNSSSSSSSEIPPNTLSSISVTTQPTKKSYINGDSFDPTGMVVTATYSDDTTDPINNELLTFSPNPLTTGTTEVTVSYTEGGVTETANVTGITVQAKTLSSISIKTPATQTTFKFQEPFSYSGLIINAIYNSGTEEKTSGFTVTGVNTSVLGSQTATVTFEGSTATYAVTVTNVGSVGNDLLISEYVEGSSNNKYVEIFNPTSSSINLNDYELRVFSNGSSSSTTGTPALTGNLASGATIVYQNSSAALTLPSGVTATTNSAVNFSGDDALGLWKISTSNYVDIFGKIGQDPGNAWTSGGVSTENKTLRRKPSIKNGVTSNPSTFNPSLEWDQFDVDTVSGLGSHSVNSVDAATQASAYRDYLSNFETCSVISSQDMNTLITEYNAMAADSKTQFSSLTVSDYDQAAYLANGSSYEGLSKTIEGVNALVKLDAIIARYNAANPSSTVTRNANGNFVIEDRNQLIQMDWGHQLILMITLISFGFVVKRKLISKF